MAIAHRGASAYAPENTLAAFDWALRMGARHIELDVHASRDGHLVVMHDNTVDRTTNGSGPVSGLPWETLASLDAGSWFDEKFSGERIPLLAEALDQAKDQAHLHVEIKGDSPGLSQRTVDLMRRHGMEKQVTFTSFAKKRLLETRAYAPEFPTGWLVSAVTDAVVAEAKAMGLTQLCPKATALTADVVHRLHAEGFVVRAWGVADEALMRRVLDTGADGMTVNFPDKLIACLAG